MSRTTGSGKVNKVKMGILIGGVLVLFLIFSTIWDQTHKQPEPQATQETASSADESTSAEESSGTDANASTEPVPDNISVNEMQAKIDELQQQIADKDASKQKEVLPSRSFLISISGQMVTPTDYFRIGSCILIILAPKNMSLTALITPLDVIMVCH